MMSDYERISKAITFITSHVATQPSLENIAAHLHMSPFHFQRLFSRWAGVSPKRFLQILTVERAKELLAEAKPLLEVSDSLGLSSGSRLYDHFVHLEGVTPGEYKKAGVGLLIEYARHETPFGEILIAVTPRGVCKLVFLDADDINIHLTDLNKQWPHAVLQYNDQRSKGMVEAMFGGKKKLRQPLSLHVSGTNFQISVWKALLQLQPASVTSYSHIAKAVGRPKAARAVGTAIGANPVAFFIPCHRVLQQSGKLGGYHWGETRKHAIHAWEAARYD